MKQAVLIAVTLAAIAPAATAADNNLPARAATSVGLFIASQGNAALAQIREELKRDLLKRLDLYLPSREEVAPDEPREDARAGS